MRLIHPRLAEWLASDPRPDGRFVLTRKAELLPVFDEHGFQHFQLRLIGGNTDDQRITCFAIIVETESGISGGGSMPDSIETAVNHWCYTAGYPSEVKGGAR